MFISLDYTWVKIIEVTISTSNKGIICSLTLTDNLSIIEFQVNYVTVASFVHGFMMLKILTWLVVANCLTEVI
jgi:hypothetical protein